MEEYIENLKQLYNYDYQTIEMIEKIINAFINVLGEEYLQIILYSINKTFIFQYDNTISATNTLNTIINDGNNHNISTKAESSGFMEDYYINSNNQLEQKYIIGISKNNSNKLETLIHELCHVISTVNKLKIEDNTIIINSGFSTTTRQIMGGKIGETINNKGDIFNEMITENLAIQIMDYLEPDISHEPTSYNGYVNDFKGIFRNEFLNKIIIKDYINSSSDFLSSLEEFITKEEIKNQIESISNLVDLNNETIFKYLEYLKTLSVNDFFELYINYCNNFLKPPEGVDKSTYRIMKKINSEIVYNLSQKLKEKNYSK